MLKGYFLICPLWPWPLKSIGFILSWLTCFITCQIWRSTQWFSFYHVQKVQVWCTHARMGAWNHNYIPSTRCAEIKMKVYVSWDTNQRPLPFQVGTLDHLAILTVDELWFKLLHYLGIWIKSTHVAIHVSKWIWLDVHSYWLSDKTYISFYQYRYENKSSISQ